MPVDLIPFDAQEAAGLEQLSGAPPLMANALTDVAGTRIARPGISPWPVFPLVPPTDSAVMGMTGFSTFLIYITADRRIWAIDSETGLITVLSDGSFTSLLDGTLRPQLLTLRTKVVAVGGGVPQEITPDAVASRLGGSPPASIGIAGIATRIVVSPYDVSGTIRWSGAGDAGHSTWDPLDFIEAEARPDPIGNVASNTNELFGFGTETTQVFSPDPTVGFAPGRALNIGVLAPFSIVHVDDQFAFLDRERRFVLTDGRSFSDEQSVISKPMESVLRSMGAVFDAWGFRMRSGRWDACVWFFPTEGRGFIWNRRNNGWSEWRAWGLTGWQPTRITSAYYWPEQNVFLVGMETGQIAMLDAEATTDLGDTIKVELVSGFVDRGTDNMKKCDAAKFVFRRGESPPWVTPPRVHVSWRDDTGAFCSPSVLDLGRAGDYEPTLELRSLGSYRRRQWRLEYTSDAGFTFVGAREQFQVLDN